MKIIDQNMREKSKKSIFRILFFLLIFALPVSADELVRLTKVQVKGNIRVETQTVLLQISSKAGDVFDSREVENDVRQIYRTGFFDQVIAKISKTDNQAILTFEVSEKPAIRKVQLVGNDKVSDETLKERLNISARRFLDNRKLQLGVDQALEYYQNQGYFGTKIDLKITEIEDNQIDLTFTVEEGIKKKIRKIKFEGNVAFSDDDLQDVIQTSRYKWWSSWITGSGVVKEDLLKNDVRDLTEHYLKNGYVDIKVIEPEVDSIKDGLVVKYKVSEGDLFTFGKISASGTLLDNSMDKTLLGVESKSSETFNVEHLRKDTFAISEKFTDIGYAFVNVEPLTSVDREKKDVSIDFNIEKGSVISIDRIRFSGNEKTQDNVIRRTLQITEQEIYSSSKIKRSQELLQRLGYFDEVTITSEPTSAPDTVDLNVAVREGNTGSFSIGAGVSSGDGFLFSSRLSENNVLGTGNSVTLDLSTGSENENYVLSFLNPRVNDSRWSFGSDLLSVEREFDDFRRHQAGGSLTVGYPLWFLGPEYLDDVQFSLTYQLLDINIDEVEPDAPQLIIDNEGKALSSSVAPQVVRNTIDNPLDPTKGSRQVVKVELAGLGGDEKFWQAEAANTWYYPLLTGSYGNLVFSQRTRIGWGDTFNGEDFPLFRRYFPGGINSVRGYDTRELGPSDEEGNEFGGSKQLIGNFEVIFPLVHAMGLNGVVFYDIGNAFDDNEDIEYNQLRQAVGWGIRWRSPIAPIRIEIGYPLDPEPDDKSVVTNFSFGSPL